MLIGSETINLRLTLIESAQSFSWKEKDGVFTAVIRGRPVRLTETESGIEAEGGLSAAELRDYLDLERDYGAIAAEYASVPVVCEAVRMYPGLRVLNQDPWETLVSFILSANNNVSRIRSLAASLCEHFGDPAGDSFAFPLPQQLAKCSEEQLRAIHTGYRAPYLIKTAQRILDGFPLRQLSEMNYDDALCCLVSLPGVGVKVANCVLLFGCRHAEAFPVDVWVERLLRAWFGLESTDRKKLTQTARDLLGPHAGIVQQFLFHAARTGAIELP